MNQGNAADLSEDKGTPNHGREIYAHRFSCRVFFESGASIAPRRPNPADAPYWNSYQLSITRAGQFSPPLCIGISISKALNAEPMTAAFGRFVALTERDAPSLVERMSSRDLRADGERYGVIQRLIARPHVQVVDLAVAVLRKLFDSTSFSSARLGSIVLSTRILEPKSAASHVAAQLGVTCSTHVVERACSGFPAATRLATKLCQTSGMPVAVVAVEIASRNINWEPARGDPSDQRRARGQAAKLFADGAAAVIVGPGGEEFPNEILDAWQGHVPDKRQLIQRTVVENAIDPWGKVRPGSTTSISMPGRRGAWLVRQAPQIMARAVSRSVENARIADHLTDEHVSHVVPHQPNGLILSRLKQELGGKNECVKVWNCIENNGNTVSASIPLAMSEVQDRLPGGSIVAMPSVGAGGPGYRPKVLSNGCVLVRMGKAL